MIDADDIDRARTTRLETIVAHLPLKRRGAEWCGPCPRCEGRDRFWINTRRQIWGCRICQTGGDVIGLAMHVHGLDFIEAIRFLIGDHSATDRRAPPPLPDAGAYKADDDEYRHRQAGKAAWLWQHRQPFSADNSTIAERYLREVRSYIGLLPPTLAFLPPRRKDHHPALIAAFALVPEIEPGVLAVPTDVRAVHLTLLRPDGTGKADVDPDKIIVGSPSGKPIVLAPPNDLLGMCFAEGIEDGLTAFGATNLGTWAAGAAGFLPALADVVPFYIECATIFSHDDPAGQRGASLLGDRLLAREISEVRIEGPP
jgi:hypothetical protein